MQDLYLPKNASTSIMSNERSEIVPIAKITHTTILATEVIGDPDGIGVPPGVEEPGVTPKNEKTKNSAIGYLRTNRPY